MSVPEPTTATVISRWSVIEPALFAFSRRYLDSGADIGDLLQDAFVDLLAGKVTWDPAKDPEPERFVFRLMKSRRARQIKHGRVVRAHEERADATAAAPSPEEVLTLPDDASRALVIQDLHERYPTGTLERAVLDLALEEGIADVAAVAKRLETPEAEVHRCRRRLKEKSAAYAWRRERTLKRIEPEAGATEALTDEEERGLDAAMAMPPAEVDAELTKHGTSAAALRRSAEAQIDAHARRAATGATDQASGILARIGRFFGRS